MLSAATRALCIALSLQSIAHIVNSHAVLPRTAGCSAECCEVNSSAHGTRLTSTNGGADHIPPHDFFAMTKGAHQHPNPAKELYDNRTSQNIPDDPIPDFGTYSKFYVNSSIAIDDFFIDDLDGRTFRPLVKAANLSVKSAGIEFREQNQNGDQMKDFHKHNWSGDRKLAVAGFGDTAENGSVNADLPWFNVMMFRFSQNQTFSGTALGGPSDLEAFGWANMTNQTTKNTIDSIFNEQNIPRINDTVLLSNSAAQGSDEAFAFDAFMMTDEGQGIYQLLGRWHQTFGDKNVTQIVLSKASQYNALAVLATNS